MENCANCWYCRAGLPWKGFCKKWDISIEYEAGCRYFRENTPKGKKIIEKARNILKKKGFVEIAPGKFLKQKEHKND